LDLDWFYRKPARITRLVFVNLPNQVFGFTEKLALAVSHKLSHFSKNPLKHLKPGYPNPDHPIKTDGFTAPLHAALALVLFCFIVVSLIVLL
jgi:hypothetical protein